MLYLTIGWLAALVAFARAGGRLADSRGALDELHRQPFGFVALLLMTIGLAGYGIWRAVQAVLDPAHEAAGRWVPLSAKARGRIVQLSRFGIAARGVVFAVAGGFLCFAAATSDPRQARGLGGSLRALRDAPFGHVLLGGVALGLAAFGVYQLLEARYRRLSGLRR